MMGYPETVLLRLIDSKGAPNVKIAATEDGSAVSLGGESNPTNVQVLARGTSTWPGECYAHQNRVGDALDLARESLATLERIFGRDRHYDSAGCHFTLAEIYRRKEAWA